MAIDWGAWEYSGGNGMRVGIDVSWEAISHAETAATATIKVYTENQYTYGDGQTLNYGGSIGGSQGFTNNDGGAQVLRDTLSYTYNYGSSEYGSSPGKRTFSATLSGAYNGVTPSNSVSSSIPARPIAAPAAVTNATVSRVSDTSQKITWTNHSTSGEPYENVYVDRSVNGSTWVNVAALSGGATSYTDSGTSADNKYDYRVRPHNSAGYASSFDYTSSIWTTPSTPTSASRANGTGAQQVVSWSNNSPGYTEYETRIERGVTSSGVTTWTDIGAAASGATSYTDTAASASQATKYRVRHHTTSGISLYSAYSGETTSTPGVTSPPNAPTALSPNNLTVDPTQGIRLAWTFQPTIAGDAQTKYDLQHRVAGTSTWTTVTTSTANNYYDLPANTYAESVIVEWQVRAYGSDPTPSPYAAPVTFTTAVAAIAPDPVKLPVLMDLFTGQLEASTTAYELRNYIQRAQSQLMGGGIRAVDASYNISWTQRFITIGLGRTGSTFPNGHHDIVNPWGWTVTNKAIAATGGVGGMSRVTLTISTGTNGQRTRLGDTVTVTGMGAPYDGQHVVREVGTSTIKFDVNPTSEVASVAASGSVFVRIQGHGGAVDSYPSAAKISLPTWSLLWYELPFGWGSGTTPRKNGVVTITSASLTSNVVTLNVTTPHYFTVGDRITVSGLGAPYDGVDRTITALPSPGQVQFSLTNANLATTSPAGALAIPSGKDTFFSNYHLTTYTGDFVVPDNWVLIAARNNDAATVEWGSGDAIDPGFDSDSPVFKQAIFNSTQDANNVAGNKPALRVGSPTAGHLRIDGNEIVAMADDNSQGNLYLNQAGNTIINDLYITSPLTGSYSANVNWNSASSPAGRVRINTSSLRFKENVRPLEAMQYTVDQILSLEPRVFQRNDDRDPETDEILPVTEDSPWYVGFIAEEAEELGLKNWVVYDEDGKPFSFAYDYFTVALQQVVRDQQKRLDSLEQRLAALESRVD